MSRMQDEMFRSGPGMGPNGGEIVGRNIIKYMLKTNRTGCGPLAGAPGEGPLCNPGPVGGPYINIYIYITSSCCAPRPPFSGPWGHLRSSRPPFAGPRGAGPVSLREATQALELVKER